MLFGEFGFDFVECDTGDDQAGGEGEGFCVDCHDSGGCSDAKPD